MLSEYLFPNSGFRRPRSGYPDHVLRVVQVLPLGCHGHRLSSISLSHFICGKLYILPIQFQ